MLKAGEVFFWVVNDHPQHPTALYEDLEYGNEVCRTLWWAEMVADKWNANSDGLHWRVREVTVLPRPKVLRRVRTRPFIWNRSGLIEV